MPQTQHPENQFSLGLSVKEFLFLSRLRKKSAMKALTADEPSEGWVARIVMGSTQNEGTPKRPFIKMLKPQGFLICRATRV